MADREVLEGLAEGILGARTEIGGRLPGRAGNSVHEVRHSTGTSFLKVGPKEDVDREAALLELLALHGVPAPSVEGRGQAGELAAIVLSAAPGRLIGDEEMPLLHQALTEVSAIAVDGLGPLVLIGGELRGRSDWPPPLEEGTTFVQLSEAGLVPEDILATSADLVRQVPRPASPRLVHGDLHPRHVFTDGRRITGIIDWGDAMAGDPLYDLGRLFQVGLVENGIERAHQLAGLPHRNRAVAGVAVYAVAYILRAMTKGPLQPSPMVPWFAAQANALRILCPLIA